jgi:hypothetical protein
VAPTPLPVADSPLFFTANASFTLPCQVHDLISSNGEQYSGKWGVKGGENAPTQQQNQIVGDSKG